MPITCALAGRPPVLQLLVSCGCEQCRSLRFCGLPSACASCLLLGARWVEPCALSAAGACPSVAMTHSAARAGVALDEAGLASLRVGQLKALLQDRGMQCKLCLDRSDYLQFIRDHLIEPDL